MAVCGGITEVKESQNSEKIKGLARFAVDEHNKKQNTVLEFQKVVNARQQLVEGMLCFITLEVTDGGKKKVYEAKIWERSWLNFKELKEFKLIADAPSHSSSA